MAHTLAPAVCKESKRTALKLVLALTASDDEKGDGSNVPSGVALEVQHPIGSNRRLCRPLARETPTQQTAGVAGADDVMTRHTRGTKIQETI